MPNGKKYIGITSQSIKKRWQNGHGYDTQLFGRAVKKYGWDNIIHEVFMDNIDKETAKQWEMALVALYHTKDPNFGYNQTDGGDSKDSKPIHTEEEKALLRERWLGDKNPNARPVICLENMKIYKTAMDALNDTGATKICDCCQRSYKHKTSAGYHWAYYDESLGYNYYKDLLEDYLKEENTPRPMPERVKQMLREITSVKVMCIETGEIFNSMEEACKAKHIQKANLCRCCRGQRKTTGGFHWKYVEE